MADWVTISALATAGGTLVLAAATFASVRSANRSATATGDAVYLAIGLRNVGNGLEVLDRWDVYPDRQTGDVTHRSPEVFRRLTRDLYVPAGDLGFWQGALRDRDDPVFAAATSAITEGRGITIDLLYGDHEGGQRTVTRFVLLPHNNGRLASVTRHWNLDRPDPR